MKNKRIRLVAMVLTMALAFSVCAMPASAASKNSWAYGGLTSNMDGSCYEWATEAVLRDILIQAWNTSYVTEYGALTETRLQTALTNYKQAIEDRNYTICEDEIPENAYFGWSQTKNSTIYWFTKTDYANIAGNTYWSVNWNTGKMTVGTGSDQKTYTAINQKTAPVADNGADSDHSSSEDSNSGTLNSGNSNSDHASAGGSASDQTGMILLLAGGAVIVGVGVYLYTHPAIVESIKNFFTGNSASQQPTQAAEAAEANTETAEKAENTAEYPAAEAVTAIDLAA